MVRFSKSTQKKKENIYKKFEMFFSKLVWKKTLFYIKLYTGSLFCQIDFSFKLKLQ